MQQQFGYSENEEGLSDSALDTILGIGGVAAGGAGVVGLEIERRRRGDPNAGFKGAVQELRDDVATSANVVLGRTPHDRVETDLAVNRGDIGDRSYRSLRDFAANSIGNDPDSFLNVSQEKGERIRNPITQAAIAARDAFNPSAEDFLSLKRQWRQEQGMSAEGPRTDTVISRIPVVDGIRDVLGNAPGGFSAEERRFRDQFGLSVMKDNGAQKVGSVGGRAASDFINNGARSLWWLINAPQAVVDLASEGAAAVANREGLYGQDLVAFDDAVNRGWIDPVTGEPNNNAVNRAVSDSKDVYYRKRYKEAQDQIDVTGLSPEEVRRSKTIYSRRRTGNNLSTLMALPAAIAINSGIGLNSPGGGTDGRKAIFPTDADPTQTSNVLAEVAAKYVLGRQGDLLPWDEFSKVRPDVSQSEYNSYKAHRWDKNTDLNPFDDGRFIAPLGIAKYTNDGINGAEVQFLGKDMPMTTAVIPTAAAILGTAAGAAMGRHGAWNEHGVDEAIKRRKAVRDPLVEREKRWGPLNNHDQSKLDKLDREILDREDRKNIVQKIPGNRFFRDRSAVGSGLIGGAAALVGSSVIGNEIERRRRAENERRFES